MSVRYIINAELCELALALQKSSFGGEIKISSIGPTGTEEMFGDPFVAMEITGFCKETVYIAWDMEQCDYIVVGRYNIINRRAADEPPTLEWIVELAWTVYKDYKRSKNWERPYEWLALWKQMGYITTKTVEKTVEVEKD